MKDKVIVLIFLFLLGIFFLNIISQFQKDRIRRSKNSLESLRNSIEWYRQETSIFPASFKEIDQYIEASKIDKLRVKLNGKPVKLFFPSYHYEYLSTFKGGNDEHHLLDNKGGFYYNISTGEVRINLTKPLKTYFFYILAEIRMKSRQNGKGIAMQLKEAGAVYIS